jgi:hypothetical protein
MADHSSLTADLFTDGQLSADRADLIADALTALGVLVRVKILPRRRGASDLQWLVLAALPLQAFLTSIGGNFADNTYKGFQAAVRKLLHHEQAAEEAAARPMVLQDTGSGLRIVLDHDLPADGYQQLLRLDLSRFRLGPLHYDLAEQRWRSELDEAALPPNPAPLENQSGK